MEPIRPSLYWDDFERRIAETIAHVKYGLPLPVRRVAVFITNQCNFRCGYCNNPRLGDTLPEEKFAEIVDKYGQTAIIHITGGEPSVVPWLYPFLYEHCKDVRFHLNTNAYICPPFQTVRRLKVSLDHYDSVYWDRLVGCKGAFDRVVANIKRSIPYTTVSITYTLTHDNYRDAIKFAAFAKQEFPDAYAVFYSIYKGDDPTFAFTVEDAETFFNEILPELKDTLVGESRALLHETIDEKRRLIQGIRFPQNACKSPCYISMSERVISPQGVESYCSHLYRDGIFHQQGERSDRCLYGCNRRLVKFNEQVEAYL